MRAVPRLLLLLFFSMSAVTMIFIARCGLTLDGQDNGPPMSSLVFGQDRLLIQVMHRKMEQAVEERTKLHTRIYDLQVELEQIQRQVENLTVHLQATERTLAHCLSHPQRQEPCHQDPTSQGSLRRLDRLEPSSSLQPDPALLNSSVPSFVLPPSDKYDRPHLSSEPRNTVQVNQLIGDIEVAQSNSDRSNSASVVSKRTNLRTPLDVTGDAAVVVKSDSNMEDAISRQKNESLVQVHSDHGGSSRQESSNSAPLENIQEVQTEDNSSSEDILHYIQSRMNTTEILAGQQYKTEYELIPFNRFIFNRIFLVDPGLGKRVVEKPIGSKKRDLNEIMYYAVESLNKNRSVHSQYTYSAFLEGMYRTDPALGSHYELFFTNKDERNSKSVRSYVKMSIFRPFAPPMLVQRTVVNTGLEWINLILPLSGRVDTFQVFMDQFVTVCIQRDRRVYLTVVYFGADGLDQVKSLMGQVAKKHKFKHMKLVTLNETFARGRGLQLGTLNWKGGSDVLLFFCDVDIVFTTEFLERCRLNSEARQRVYYPIVFSLYNPKIVYSLQDLPIPPLQDQLVLGKDTGFWRDFGYGMACMYRSDFLKIKGFDEQITGWGGEDVFLYQKFVRSQYFVMRATDPDIFHLWHDKHCDPLLSAEQYRSCIRSKALNEASHAQLGLLAFKDEIDVHRAMKQGNL